MATETISTALPVGFALNDFLIESVLGVGSYGITYLAHDTLLHQKVAIKEFFPANLAARNHDTGTVGIKSPNAREEFVWGKSRYTEEAQTLAHFVHPNIVRVYRFFEANSTSYLVMAHEKGRSLEAILNANEDWSQERILSILMPLLSGLSLVHKDGFLHRDIKPDNIIIREDGSPVLIDFGSARSMISNHTMTAMVSPGYGPVEQYSSNNEDQGPWSDIYSMAAVVYRIVTGRVPPPAPNRVKKDGMLPAAFAGAGRCSKQFLAAIDIGLRIKEEERPQSIDLWIEMLTTQESEPQPEPGPLAETVNLHEVQSVPMALVTAPLNSALLDTSTTAKTPVAPSSGSGPVVDTLTPTASTFNPLPNHLDQERNQASSHDDNKAKAVRLLQERGQHHAVLENKSAIEDTASPYQVDDGHYGGGRWPVSGALGQVLKGIVFGALVSFVAVVIGIFAIDKAFLPVAYYAYTSALKANNSSLTYAFVCPSYFQSTMTHDDLLSDLDLPKFPQDVTVLSPGSASISSNITVDGSAGAVLRKQSWAKPGVFWCRDALTDFKERKEKRKEDAAAKRTAKPKPP